MIIKNSDLLRRFRSDQSGASGIEYALIAGAFALAIIGSVQIVATETQKPFESVAVSIATVTP